jgi:hypothetical protein
MNIQCPHCNTEVKNIKNNICEKCNRDIRLQILAKTNPPLFLLIVAIGLFITSAIPIFGWIVAPIFIPLAFICLLISIIWYLGKKLVIFGCYLGLHNWVATDDWYWVCTNCKKKENMNEN